MGDGFWMAVLQGVAITLLVSGMAFMARGMLGYLLALIPGLEPDSVRGTWDTKWCKGDTERTEEVELKQFLHHVWGTVTYTRDDGVEKTYKLRGIIKRRVFVATYEIKGDPAALDLGSFTVRITDGFGKRMKGQYSWPDDKTQEVISGEYRWKKREVKGKKEEVD